MMSELKPMEKDQIESIVKSAIDDALSFIESEVAEDRIKAQKYYNGDCGVAAEEGRSRVVATKVRDTIRSIKPSLMRIFLSNEKFVEFTPKRQDQVAQAEMASKYIHYKFDESNGYQVLSDAIHDALLKKAGIVKTYWDDYEESEMHELTNLTEMELSFIAQEDDVDIIEQSTEFEVEINEFGIETEVPKHSIKIAKRNKLGCLRVESVPPEEFFVDRDAVNIDDCYIVGHRTEMRVGDLVAAGYDFEDVSELSGIDSDSTMEDAEKFERTSYSMEDDDESEIDPSMKLVAVTECYMRIDVDGIGIPQLHKITMGGGEYKLLDIEPVSEIPFAIFECDPEPHTFFGNSVADLIINDQDTATALLRGVLDNVSMTNNPRLGVVESQVEMADVLNNEIGAIVRMKSAGAIQELAVPFVAGQTLGALEYYDQVVEQKTGVTRASNGLDPDALQNATATAVQMTQSAGQGQVEVIARNIAEGGMKRLFKLMLKILSKNSPEQELMSIAGADFVPIDPRAWDLDMGIGVNVGLGTGKEDQKAAALMQTLQTQMQIFQTYGAQNGVVGLTNIRNTLADILALGGFRNADRYYAPMNPQIEMQLMQQQMAAAQNQQQPQDPAVMQAQAMIEMENIKAQAKMQSDQMKLQLDAQKEIAKDDRERDQMDADLLVKAAEILGKYGSAVDVERIKQMQAQPRYPDSQPTAAATEARY
jgi:hypothetical protein